MAHATHVSDFSPEEGLREINADRTRRSWIAAVLFVVSAAGVAAGAYFSYRDVPAPANPANNAPGLLDPYH
ncbi:MAG: hypothetical protein EOO73_25445 [Myxococcales bacterium]|nr:MAG: hypothetical protein EOO73_25445 [Myxococcales bacterium]